MSIFSVAAETIWVLSGGHGLGHLLGGCTGGWRGLGLKPQVSEEQRSELL